MKLYSITTKTPDGDFHMIMDEDEVVRASGFGALDALKARLPDDLQKISIESVGDHPYQAAVKAYYQGNPQALTSIPNQQNGTKLQTLVWAAMSKIPYGKTVSYKALAEAAGYPAAVRAVGSVCGQNRLILLVPCHRVIKSDGSLGSYLYGPNIKKHLLQIEGAFHE